MPRRVFILVKCLLLTAVVIHVISNVPVYGQAQDNETRRLSLLNSANAGIAESQNDLGAAYFDGSWGLSQDWTEAARWFRLAADQGLATAQLNLGRLYASGRGVPQDMAETARWFGLAAAQGSPEAQAGLGSFYLRNDLGVSQDYVQAYKWLSLGTPKIQDKNYREPYERYLASLIQKMTPDQRAEGDKLVTEWRPVQNTSTIPTPQQVQQPVPQDALPPQPEITAPEQQQSVAQDAPPSQPEITAPEQQQKPSVQTQSPTTPSVRFEVTEPGSARSRAFNRFKWVDMIELVIFVFFLLCIVGAFAYFGFSVLRLAIRSVTRRFEKETVSSHGYEQPEIGVPHAKSFKWNPNGDGFEVILAPVSIPDKTDRGEIHIVVNKDAVIMNGKRYDRRYFKGFTIKPETSGNGDAIGSKMLFTYGDKSTVFARLCWEQLDGFLFRNFPYLPEHDIEDMIAALNDRLRETRDTKDDPRDALFNKGQSDF